MSSQPSATPNHSPWRSPELANSRGPSSATLHLASEQGVPREQGTKVINFEGACCDAQSANGAPPKRVLSDFHYNLQPGERLGIVGPNGAGKSTLLRLISGASPPAEGFREQGETIVTGFLTQEPLKINEQETIVNHMRWGPK